MLTWIRDNWWVLALRGLLAVIFGVLAWIWPDITLEVLVIFFGAYTLVDALVMLFNALANRRLYPQWGRLLLGGILGIVLGVLTFVWPRMTALVLLYLIAARALVLGGLEIIAAINLRKEISGEWLLGLSGLLSIVFGLVLVAWPGSGALAIIWLIGTYAIVFGILQIILAFRVRGWRKQVFVSTDLLCMLLMLLALSPVKVLAQGPVLPQQNDPNWSAAYWNNLTLSGPPVLVQSEANLNYNWGEGAPHPSVSEDQFSARWLRYIDVTPGTYRFIVTSDDGVRLWVDDTLLVDEWNDHAEETFYADHYLEPGHHLIKVEYYENKVAALLQVSWLKADQGVGRWRGEYYNNMTLSGTPALARNEAVVDFTWYTRSPDVDVISPDHFSARWTRTANVNADNYRFTLTVDDGARLWVNGHLLIDAWYDQAATVYTEDIYLPGGEVTLELQYYENTGYARVQLSWSPEFSGIPVEENAVIVDDEDPGFVQGGTASAWRTESEGYEDHLTWTYNNERVQANYNWARWYPDLPAGDYEVFVYIPDRYSTTSQARYWVAHADGLSLHTVDQSANGGLWVALGTYSFRGDGSDYVSLADVTFEPRLSHIIAFDAVKWEPR